jgi:hypothetical protein
MDTNPAGSMLHMRVILLAALLGGLACAGPTILMLDGSVRPRTSPQSIRLIAQEPTRPYVVVAIVSTVGDVESARHELIKQAARLGGHAILFDTSSITRSGGDQSSSPVLTGKVIVYTDSTGSN